MRCTDDNCRLLDGAHAFDALAGVLGTCSEDCLTCAHGRNEESSYPIIDPVERTEPTQDAGN